MKRALKVAGLTFLVVNVCWLALNYIAGSVPSTNEFLWFVENVNEEDVRIIWTNPFAVSRIPFDGIFIGFLGLIFYLVATTNKIQQDITGDLIVGLAIGLVGGLIGVVGLAIGLVVGLAVGLVGGLTIGLVDGLADGLVVGLIGGLSWTVGYSFWLTMEFGASIGFGSFLLILFASCVIPAIGLLIKNRETA